MNQCAVLASGGLDSSILLLDLLAQGRSVVPIYVRSGFLWEPDEMAHLDRLLDHAASACLAPLVVLDVPVANLLPNHWSITGIGVPSEHSSDDAVYLPGRNLLLLSKALIWCHLNQVPRIALATLRGNPFHDATPAFMRLLESAANEALQGNLSVEQPYLRLTKREVLLRVPNAPLQLTFCCLRPTGGKHCGKCNKCEERRNAFAAAGFADHTAYAHNPPA